MIGSKDERFLRPRFSPLHQIAGETSANNSIRTLPDLIEFNARHNPDHSFCLQAELQRANGSSNGTKGTWVSCRITFQELKDAVDACCLWLDANVTSNTVVATETLANREPPVAIYLESDVSLFIYLSALLALNIPAVLLSARLSPENVRHLLKETGATSILVSKRTEPMVAATVVDIVKIIPTLPYFDFLGSRSSLIRRQVSNERLHVKVDEDDRNVLILHSSGTTGLPKPMPLAHRYVLGYAACHAFPEHEDVEWPNLSTLPLYHGFGLLAPSLSLSIGMTCCFPVSSTIPAAHSTLELLSLFKARSLMTVPSILEDIINLPDSERPKALALLAPLHFTAVGGGPLKPEIGKALAANGVKLLNHYGVTEIGAIAPIFKPESDYDWRYLRLRSDLGLHLKPVGAAPAPQTPETYKLVGYPIGWDAPFEVQDEIVKRPVDSGHVEIKILGRHDDMIVLRTGEKVSPRLIEETLCQDAAVRTAVCVGQGRFELAVLIEPSVSAPTDPELLVNHVWRLISALNSTVDQHARISSKGAIIIKSAEKTLPRSDKGSVMRGKVHDLFHAEIEEAFDRLEADSCGERVSINLDKLEESLTNIAMMVLRSKIPVSSLHLEDDLFELGMDSLQATRFARYLKSGLAKTSLLSEQLITRDFVYQHPSIGELARTLRKSGTDGQTSVDDILDRQSKIVALAEEYLGAMGDEAANSLQLAIPGVVLVTGSTGNLGTHVLESLAKSKRVQRVIGLNRANVRDSPSMPNGTVQDPSARQERANTAADVTIEPAASNKIEQLEANTQADDLGLSREQRSRLAQTVTHIVHLAWPMDFNRRLKSYKPQLNAVKSLIDLAVEAHHTRPRVKPRLIFASSISVVRHHPDLTGDFLVPEAPLQDPRVTAPMGYAEAKWICEQMLARAAHNFPEHLEPMVVRIGQLSGPERTDGIWKTEEHIPALIKASQMISAFPSLQGNFSWLPVDRAARSLVDILFQSSPRKSPFYHLENPIRQPLSDLGAIVIDELGLHRQPIPFQKWLERVQQTGYAASLTDFFQNEFQTLASGSVVLDTVVSREVSRTLRGSCGVEKDLIVAYIDRWRRMRFLD